MEVHALPKRIYSSFYRALYRDILYTYKAGEKYSSIREIGEKFGVSVQTAQRGVSELCAKGILTSRPKVGIFVTGETEDTHSLEGKKLIVLSKIDNPQFYKPFFDGVLRRIGNLFIDTQLVINEHKDVTSLKFGTYLVDLDADGIILLNFLKDSVLPMYHAMREHTLLVSDVIIDSLPLLPAVQTDNYFHAYQAGQNMIERGLTQFVVFGFYPKENRRFQGFSDAVQHKAHHVQYVKITEIDSMSIALSILRKMSSHTGIFLSDYAVAHYIASLCSRYGIKFAPNSIVAYDGEESSFVFPGVQEIPCVAPSFHELGFELCHTMLSRWTTGEFPQPLQRKL